MMCDSLLPRNCNFYFSTDYSRVEWKEGIKGVLVVHKLCDSSVIERLKSFIHFTLKKWDLTVYLESTTLSELKKDDLFYPIIRQYVNFGNDESPQVTVEQNACELRDNTAESSSKINPRSSIRVFDHTVRSKIDLIVCLGGDGTLLQIASMFQGVTPPVIAFRLGTLGFLTPFPFKTFRTHMKSVLEGSSYCVLRARLCCQVIRNSITSHNGNNSPEKQTTSTTGNQLYESTHSNDSSPRSSSLDTEYHFLNDLVIDRGLSPFLCDLLIKVNGREVTIIEGDGLIISTPTGSTAYSMTAGASMVHPCVPALVLTPINSLALSSRAIVLPTSIKLEISIDSKARCSAVHFSFDGRSRHSNLLHKGDVILVSASPFPIPCLCSENEVTDWFCGLAHCLNWNLRRRQNEVIKCCPTDC
ncbi:NAD kinase [Schistosoma japonicum]|nr:NAD kinase [Schistosoma japonicum]